MRMGGDLLDVAADRVEYTTPSQPGVGKIGRTGQGADGVCAMGGPRDEVIVGPQPTLD